MRLLIIGDLEGQIGSASRIARARGAKVAQVSDIQGGFQMLCEGQGADLILIDVHEDIFSLRTMLDNERIHVEIVACGVESDTKAAVAAIKAGAKEYMPLPPDDELIAAVFEAIAQEDNSIIYGSAATKQVLTMAEQIAPSEASILITGESGVGKEVFAKFIHQKSKRSSKPFISVNCAAIPENLLESELFGHEKGAFTGAVARRIGKFEEANGGTLLLDEISEMDIGLQAKLLRAIQEREIDRVGGKAPVRVDIRILATSNRDMEAEVSRGTFREDLYFRLNVIQLNIPSLSQRVDDIEPLAEYFAEKYSEANHVPLRPISPEALDKLKGYHWPGNVRELENTMHRAVLMAQGNAIGEQAILLTHGQNNAAEQAAAFAPQEKLRSADVMESEENDQGKRNELVGRSLASVEKELILDTLDYCLGNRTHAAKILGISIRTLRNKLKQYSDGTAPQQASNG